MDGYTNDHRPTDRWTNGWKMFLSHTDAIDASEKDDFPTDFSILNTVTDQWTDGPTYPLIEMQ